MPSLLREQALVFLRSESGSTAVEYGLVLAIIVAALVVSLTGLGASIASAIDAVGAKMIASS
jgi:Flp pilus assembly pilin Flp